MTGVPKYWGSWKGRVIKAIIGDHAKTWLEIRDLTGLSPKSLNIALSEMFDLGILEKKGGKWGAQDKHDNLHIHEKRGETYWVAQDIYDEYKKFLTKGTAQAEKSIIKAPVKFSEEIQKALVDWIDQWREVKKLDFSLENKHFFLVGRHLDEISKELISNAKSEVLVANPYVNHCDLSNTLRNASKKGVSVNLVTRPPGRRRERTQHDMGEYHKLLKEDGVEVMYNKSVHAKLVIVDRAAAISSSMNFFSTSSSGASWEAGLISVEKKVVESIVNSVLELLEKPESKEMGEYSHRFYV